VCQGARCGTKDAAATQGPPLERRLGNEIRRLPEFYKFQDAESQLQNPTNIVPTPGNVKKKFRNKVIAQLLVASLASRNTFEIEA